MTSRERLLTVLNGKRADRMPVTLFIQEQGHFISQLYPEVDPWDFNENLKRIVEFQKELKLDVHVRMLFFNPKEPVFAHFGLLNIQNQTREWQVTTKQNKNGNTLQYEHEIKTPDGNLYQTFSVNELRAGTFMFACTEKPIKNSEDLSIARAYEPSFSEETKQKMKKNAAIIKDHVGDSGIVSAWTNGGLFNNISGLIDHTLLYSIFLTDPEYYADLMQFAKKRVSDYTDAVLDAGVDALCIGGNVAGGFIGGKFFEEFVLPYEKKYIQYAQRKGQPVIYHNCGQVMELVESYKKMRMKNVEPFSPPPLGDGDIDKLCRLLDQEFAATCGVDQVNVLQNGTLQDVGKVTLDTIQKAKKLDRVILQSADFLEYGTPIANIKEFAKVALENADY